MRHRPSGEMPRRVGMSMLKVFVVWDSLHAEVRDMLDATLGPASP